MTRQAELTALLARIDQEIAEAKALIENANMPVPEWVRANELLIELKLERDRKRAEARLRAARSDGGIRSLKASSPA